MTIESERLLPCPFCGKQDAYVERYDYSSSYVVCDGEVEPGCACLARGPLAVQDADDEEIPGKEAAIRAWNTRAQSSGPVVAVSELEKLVGSWMITRDYSMNQCGIALSLLIAKHTGRE